MYGQLCRRRVIYRVQQLSAVPPPCSSHGRLANIYPFVRHSPIVLDDEIRWAAWTLVPSWSIVTILGMLIVSPLCTLSLRTVIMTELLTTVSNNRRFMDFSGMFLCLEKYDERKGRRAAAQSCKRIPAQGWALYGLTASQIGCPISAWDNHTTCSPTYFLSCTSFGPFATE